MAIASVILDKDFLVFLCSSIVLWDVNMKTLLLCSATKIQFKVEGNEVKIRNCWGVSLGN